MPSEAPSPKNVLRFSSFRLASRQSQSGRDDMFIVIGLDKVPAAPKERNVAVAHRCCKHFAPLELLSLGCCPIYKHWLLRSWCVSLRASPAMSPGLDRFFIIPPGAMDQSKLNHLIPAPSD